MKSLLNKILDGRFISYLWRSQKLVWYWNNRKAIKLFSNRLEIDQVQQRLIKDLRETGIAIGHLDEMFDGIFAEILIYNPIKIEGKASLRKPYFQELRESFYRAPNFILDFKNPLIQIALSRKTLDIVNSYLGMYSRFFE
jgi:hypothetical protein